MAFRCEHPSAAQAVTTTRAGGPAKVLKVEIASKACSSRAPAEPAAAGRTAHRSDVPGAGHRGQRRWTGAGRGTCRRRRALGPPGLGLLRQTLGADLAVLEVLELIRDQVADLAIDAADRVVDRADRAALGVPHAQPVVVEQPRL